MKTYIKPELQVREIRVMENLAKISTPAGVKLNWLKAQAPSTVYSLAQYSNSGAQPPVVEGETGAGSESN